MALSQTSPHLLLLWNDCISLSKRPCVNFICPTISSCLRWVTFSHWENSLIVLCLLGPYFCSSDWGWCQWLVGRSKVSWVGGWFQQQNWRTQKMDLHQQRPSKGAAIAELPWYTTSGRLATTPFAVPTTGKSMGPFPVDIVILGLLIGNLQCWPLQTDFVHLTFLLELLMILDQMLPHEVYEEQSLVSIESLILMHGTLSCMDKGKNCYSGCSRCNIFICRNVCKSCNSDEKFKGWHSLTLFQACHCNFYLV